MCYYTRIQVGVKRKSKNIFLESKIIFASALAIAADLRA